METGLIVRGGTSSDNYAIGKLVDEKELYAEWNADGGYWFFPEDEDMYDNLEMMLTRDFDQLGINASFEGIF